MLKVRSYFIKRRFQVLKDEREEQQKFTLNRPGTCWDLEPALEFVSLFYGFNIFTVERSCILHEYFVFLYLRNPNPHIEHRNVKSNRILKSSDPRDRTVNSQSNRSIPNYSDRSISASAESVSKKCSDVQPQICPQSTIHFIFGSSFPSP